LTAGKKNINLFAIGSEYMTIMQTAARIIEEGPICDNCMGRQFARLLTGLTNAERGEAIKLSLSLEAARLMKEEGYKDLLEKLALSNSYACKTLDASCKEEECWVCIGLFDNLDEWVDRAIKALEGIEYSTFVVCTKVSGLLAENEEILWAECGADYAEQLKTELNREIGKRLAGRSGKEVDIKMPDVVVILDIAKEDIILEIRSVYVEGRYRKLVRGIPQTRWPCRKCKGKGCQSCDNTGKQYPESVDELVSEPVIEAFDSDDTKFHGAGREDIDALMLGAGRPFVVEAINPGKRNYNLSDLEEQINSKADGKIEVEGLKFADKARVQTLKNSTADKVYKLKVTFNAPVTEDAIRTALEDLQGNLIEQRTPQRVSHRRADLVRKRQVHSIELLEYHQDHAIIRVDCEGGLYVKELISSDEGRTTPSLTGLLGIDAVVEELDVVDVKI